MGRRAQPYPVLIGFAAFFGGVVAAGMLGAAHAFLLLALVVTLATLLTWARGLDVPRLAGPVLAIAVLGIGRAAVREALTPGAEAGRQVGAARPDHAGRTSADVRVERVTHRDRVTTSALAEVVAVLDGDRWRPVDPPAPVVVRHRGFLGLLGGARYVVRGRLHGPPPTREALGPAWPGPTPWPSLGLGPESDLVTIHGPDVEEPGPVERARLALAERLRLALTGDAADFAQAILLGEGGGMDPALRHDLSVLGTAHILAVSGLHVSAAAAVLGLLFIRLIGPLLARAFPGANLALLHAVLSALAAVGIATLAGLPPSARRASGMFVFATTGAAAGRPVRLEASVSAVGLAWLLADPGDATTLSFLLSYSAIFGIATLAGPLSDLVVPRAWSEAKAGDLPRWTRAARALLVLTATSLGAALATAPVTALAFGVSSPWSPFVNLVAVPVMTLVAMPLAVALLLAAALLPAAVPVLAPAAGPVFAAFLAAQRALAAVLPPVTWAESRAGLAAVVGTSVGAWCGLATRRWALAAGVALVGAWAAWTFGHPVAADGDGLEVTVLDVGKGDAVLFRCPTGSTYLLDTGEAKAAEGASGLVSKLDRLGVHRLDGVVLTHSDDDHVGGTAAVVRAFAVAEITYPCPAGAEPPMPELLAEAAAHGVPSRCVVAGMEALPGCADRSTILWPPPFAIAHHNGASLVFRLAWRGRSFVFTGDLEAEQEQALLDAGADLGADVLKLAHHGGAKSSSPAFLAAVRPSIAIVSGYGNRVTKATPQDVLERVDRVGARLCSTLASGDLTLLVPDGSMEPAEIATDCEIRKGPSSVMRRNVRPDGVKMRKKQL